MPHLPACHVPIPTSSGCHPGLTCRGGGRILARNICARHHVPTCKLSTAQIRADMAGIDSSAPHKSDHGNDPGP